MSLARSASLTTQPSASLTSPTFGGFISKKRIPSDDAMVAKVGVLAAEILGRPVQPRQNLFDCGATSLHIVRLQRRLADQLGSPLAVVDLFRLPTVADLAAAISGSQQTDAVEAGLARAARRREMRLGRARAAVGDAP